MQKIPQKPTASTNLNLTTNNNISNLSGIGQSQTQKQSTTNTGLKFRKISDNFHSANITTTNNTKQQLQQNHQIGFEGAGSTQGSQNQNINMNNYSKINNVINGISNLTASKNNGDKSKRNNFMNSTQDKNSKTQNMADNMQAIIDQVQTSTLNSKQGTQVISKKLLQAANAENDKIQQKSQLNLTHDLQNMKFKIKKVQHASIIGKKKDSQVTRNGEIQKAYSKQNHSSLIEGLQQTGTSDIYRNEYLSTMGGTQNYKKSATINRNSQKQVTLQKQNLNKSDILSQQRKNSNLNKSPIFQDQLVNQSNDYYSLEQTVKSNIVNQQSPQDNDFNIPGFLAQENFDQNDYNSQFYKTQVYQQPPTTANNLNMTQASNNSNTSKTNVSIGLSNIKLSKSQLNQYNINKKSSVNQSSKTQIMKNNKATKDISPLNNRLKGEHSILEKYLANNEFASYGMNFTQQVRQKKRNGLNASALIINNQSNADYLNSTAPIDMKQLNNLYTDEQIGYISGVGGLTDVVNSTQNLRRINSKESWKGDATLSSSLYYGGNRNGVMNLVNNDIQQIAKSSNNTTQNTVTPLKDQRKKQILIKNILLQDGFNLHKNKKYFLNLTLQQLIQQQKQAQNLNKVMSQFDINKSAKSQKRLNKTLDNIKQDKMNDKINQQEFEDNEDLRSFIANFVQGGQLPQNYTAQSKENSRQQVKSFSSSVNKFSNTMKISDFNNTQQIFPGVNKKSKSSLKSTQNINLQDIGISQSVIHNQNPHQPQKYSALSIYSQNMTGNGIGQTSTYGGVQGKQRKVVSTKTGGVHINAQSSKNIIQQKHKKKTSQDQELIKMINFYQDDAMSKFNNIDLKNKTHGPGMKTSFNAYQPQTKFKTNSTLNHYLNNTKSKKIMLGEQGMSTSILKQIQDQPGKTLNKTQLTNQDYQNITYYTNDTVMVDQSQKDVKRSSSKRFINSSQQRNNQKDLAQSALLSDYNQQQIATQLQYADLTQNINPYNHSKKSINNHNSKKVQQIQNKTQPIPRHILEMAQAEAINFSTGTSIIVNKQQSKESNKSKSTKQQQRQGTTSNTRLKQIQEIQTLQQNFNDKNQKQQQREDPSQIYHNKNTVILDEVNSRDQDSLEEGYDDNGDLNQKLDRFILGKQIGQGAYAVVRVATLKKTGKKYAIKVYDKSKLTDTNRQRSVRREIKLLQKMNHQNIVKIYEAFETDNHVYLVMEYVGGDNLYTYLKQHKHSRLEEHEAKRIFKQLLTALQYCHRKSIAHRDIKLENILLDDERNVKLLDFGFSTCIPNDKKIKMFCGTPSYMAPEIVNKEEYAGPPADIWASGVLLYALMNGKFPFRGDTDRDLYRRINRGTFEIHNTYVSQHLINFLTRMINTNADLRPSAEQLLQDEWFKVEIDQVSVAENEKLKKDYMNDQKKLFKAKILSKIPVEKQKNTICLISTTNEKSSNGQKVASHNINLGAVNQSSINPIANFRQNQNDQSDYGMNNNPMRKLNQEAYQAYYNTSGGAYGQTNNNVQNPYYNSFFSQNNNGGFYSNQTGQNTGNLGYYPSFQGQNRLSPSKAQNMNINTNPQFFPINFNQQPPNQIGTPQVFGSPTGFHCQGNLINNNFNIVNNITQVTCLPQPPNVSSGVNSQDPKSINIVNQENNNTAQQQYSDNQQFQNYNIDQQTSNPQADLPISQTQSDLDEGIIDSIAQMGYHRSHVVSQLECESSHIAVLYNKLKEEKMSMTQNRPLSLQPQGRRMQYGLNMNYHQNYNDNPNHNNAVYAAFQPHNFIPSITDSLKGTGDNETSGEYTQMCNPGSNKALSNHNIRFNNMNVNNRNIKLLNNNYTDYDYENSSGTGEYQFMNSGSNTLQNTGLQVRDNYSPKIVSLNSSDM